RDSDPWRFRFRSSDSRRCDRATPAACCMVWGVRRTWAAGRSCDASLTGLGAAWEPAMAALWTMLALLLILTRSRPLLYLLPVLLAFDNFVAGTATTQAALPLDAVLSCLASATMAAAGLFVGR